MRPHAGQARQKILILRQLDLQLALARLGAVGKDIQNERAAVDDTAVQLFFQRACLRRPQLIVKNDQLYFVVFNELTNLPAFSLPDEGMRIRAFAVLYGGQHRFAPRRLQKL